MVTVTVRSLKDPNDVQVFDDVQVFEGYWSTERHGSEYIKLCFERKPTMHINLLDYSVTLMQPKPTCV